LNRRANVSYFFLSVILREKVYTSKALAEVTGYGLSTVCFYIWALSKMGYVTVVKSRPLTFTPTVSELPSLRKLRERWEKVHDSGGR